MSRTNRLVIMRDGRIVEELTASEIASMNSEDAYKRDLRAFEFVNTPPELLAQDSSQKRVDKLVCRDFEFRYKNSDNGISIPHLEFNAGEITAIVGRNGTGKSTFAHLLCGLLRKGRSTVEFGGRSFKPKERTQLCYMILQDVNHQLFTDSVLEEAVLSAPGGMTHEQAEERAREVLAKLDLSELADVHPMALSGGQKQRVAIASGVMAENPVLLFDEPTSGLDLPHMRQVADLLRTLRDTGKVVLVITHDTELICEAADRVVTLT